MKYLSVEDPNNFYYIDVETDELSHSKIHCAVVLNKGTRQVTKFINDGSASVYHDIRKFLVEREHAQFCAHNGLSFDAPVLASYTGTEFNPDRWVDTLVLSYLWNPGLENPVGCEKGPHSLEAYGIRLKFPKVQHSDWSKFSPEMLKRCEVDVNLLERVHDELLRRLNKVGFSELSAEIEHKIRVIIDKQEQNGFWFNKVRADDLLRVLTRRESDLSPIISRLFPPERIQVGSNLKRFKKDGSYTAQYQKNVLTDNYIIRENEDGTYDTFIDEPFNPSSPKQRLERLLRLGYIPTARTKKGNPKVDEDALEEYAKENTDPAIRALAEYLVVTGRRKMIAGNPDTGSPGWLGYYNPETSRIYGKVLTCGAMSRRMAHTNPNMGNIPSPQNGAQYGSECRSCWGVTPGLNRVLVGYDATGLEAHVMCHFLNSQAANRLLLEGDVHESNKIALQTAIDAFLGQGWGTVVRGGGGAKTALYAALYGAWPKRLGGILKQGPAVGEVMKKVLFSNVPNLGREIKRAEEEWSHTAEGFIKCLDGGFVRAPSGSAAFNYKIQPNGSIMMKMTAILLDKKLREAGLWHMKVVDVHDEGQHEANEKDAEEIGKAAQRCITEAGERLNFRVKMEGQYKIGQHWGQTH